MKLIIIRHGETEENVAGIIQGHLPGKLSKNGITQAKKVALRFKDEKIDYIYSSDLARAADTAKEIAKYHSETPIEFVKNLREKDLGEFAGKRKEEIKYTGDEKITFVEPRNGETTKQLFERAKKVLDETIKRHSEDVVMFVCHGGIGKALIAAINGKEKFDFEEIERLHNTSVNIYEIDKEKNNELLCFNCINHLDLDD